MRRDRLCDAFADRVAVGVALLRVSRPFWLHRRCASSFCPAPPRVTNSDSLPDLRPPLVPTPKVVRGLYVNRWAALGDRGWQLIGLASRTEVNALVIDVKDDRGFVLYRSRVPLARAIGADTNRPMRHERLRAMLDSMRAHHIYPIARIVVAKDPLLANAKLEWAIGGRPIRHAVARQEGESVARPAQDGRLAVRRRPRVRGRATSASAKSSSTTCDSPMTSGSFARRRFRSRTAACARR